MRSSDGHVCAVYDLGGRGPAALLTHGTGLNTGMWAAVVPHLFHHYHCYGLDFRGHGAAPSSDPELPIERSLLVDDLRHGLADLGIEAPLLAGHSLGAGVAVLAELAHPGTIAAAWLFEPVLIPWDLGPNPTADVLIDAAKRRRDTFGSREEAYQRLAARPPFNDSAPSALRGYVDAGTYERADRSVALSCIGVNEARIYQTAPRQDYTTYERLDLPVLVARGGTADSGGVPAQLAPRIASSIPGAQLETHGHLTHLGPMEDPTTVASSIHRFFQQATTR